MCFFSLACGISSLNPLKCPNTALHAYIPLYGCFVYMCTYFASKTFILENFFLAVAVPTRHSCRQISFLFRALDSTAKRRARKQQKGGKSKGGKSSKSGKIRKEEKYLGEGRRKITNEQKEGDKVGREMKGREEKVDSRPCEPAHRRSEPGCFGGR